MAAMLGRAGAAAMLLAAACSTLPADHYPPFEEQTVAAAFEFGPGAEHKAAVPASDESLVVYELTSTPPAVGEVFEHGQRFLLAPPDCTRFVVRCRYRAYGDGRAMPQPAALFPGATVEALH